MEPAGRIWGATYFTYNRPGPTDGEHRVNVAKRSSGGSWTTGCLKNSSGACTAYWDDVGHNQPSIGVDGDGFVHAFVSMHNDAWRYYRSGSPGGVSDMVDRSSEMPDGGDRYTYPVLERAPNGDLYLLIRACPPGSDSTYGRLYRWNDATDAWSRVATFAYQGGYSVYPDDLQADANGDLHILYEWHLAPAGPTRHLGSYLRYSPSTGKFYKADGSAVAVPASTGTGDVYQPFEGAEGWTPDGDNTSAGLQGAKLAVYPTGGGYKPSVAYGYREADGGFYKVRRARWDGSGWAKETVYGGKYDTYAAVDTTHDGSVARVYYAKKNTLGGDQAHAATKTPSSGWSETSILPSKKVERLSVAMRFDGTDVLYLAAPMAVSSTTGELYFGTFAR